jgi:Ca2+-binding EF-hand superfamily protein
MGSGASSKYSIGTLNIPDVIDKSKAKELAGDVFDSPRFNHLAQEGKISRKMFLEEAERLEGESRTNEKSVNVSLPSGHTDAELEQKMRKQCRRMFGRMDVDHGGVITKDELEQFYIKSGADPNNDPEVRKQLEAQWSQVDVNGDGEISLVEYEKLQVPVMMRAYKAKKAQAHAASTSAAVGGAAAGGAAAAAARASAAGGAAASTTSARSAEAEAEAKVEVGLLRSGLQTAMATLQRVLSEQKAAGQRDREKEARYKESSLLTAALIEQQREAVEKLEQQQIDLKYELEAANEKLEAAAAGQAKVAAGSKAAATAGISSNPFAQLTQMLVESEGHARQEKQLRMEQEAREARERKEAAETARREAEAKREVEQDELIAKLTAQQDGFSQTLTQLQNALALQAVQVAKVAELEQQLAAARLEIGELRGEGADSAAQIKEQGRAITALLSNEKQTPAPTAPLETETWAEKTPAKQRQQQQQQQQLSSTQLQSGTGTASGCAGSSSSSGSGGGGGGGSLQQHFTEQEQLLMDEIGLKKSAQQLKTRQRVLQRKQANAGAKGGPPLTVEEEAELRSNAATLIQNGSRQKLAREKVEAQRVALADDLRAAQQQSQQSQQQQQRGQQQQLDLVRAGRRRSSLDRQHSKRLLTQQHDSEALVQGQIDLQRSAKRAKTRQRVLLRKQRNGVALTDAEQAELRGNAALVIQSTTRRSQAKGAVDTMRLETELECI